MKSLMQRQEEAAERNKAYAALSLEEKIYQCTCRRGQSLRELQKLSKLQEAQKPIKEGE